METNDKEYFTIRELVGFGIGECTLRNWHREGLLKPSAFCGRTPKFRKRDFEQACQASVNTEQEKARNLYGRRERKLNKKIHKPIYDDIAEKYIKKAQ